MEGSAGPLYCNLKEKVENMTTEPNAVERLCGVLQGSSGCWGAALALLEDATSIEENLDDFVLALYERNNTHDTLEEEQHDITLEAAEYLLTSMYRIIARIGDVIGMVSERFLSKTCVRWPPASFGMPGSSVVRGLRVSEIQGVRVSGFQSFSVSGF